MGFELIGKMPNIFCTWKRIMQETRPAVKMGAFSGKIQEKKIKELFKSDLEKAKT